MIYSDLVLIFRPRGTVARTDTEVARPNGLQPVDWMAWMKKQLV